MIVSVFANENRITTNTRGLYSAVGVGLGDWLASSVPP